MRRQGCLWMIFDPQTRTESMARVYAQATGSGRTGDTPKCKTGNSGETEEGTAQIDPAWRSIPRPARSIQTQKVLIDRIQ